MKKLSRPRTSFVSVENLESRQLFAAVYPTAAEQYMLQLVNAARANPTGTAAGYGINLNEGLAAGTISSTPKQPLAFNPNLGAAARNHSQWMINNQTFSHNEGSANPGNQMSSNGYAFTGSWSWGQNIAWQGSRPNTPALTPTVVQEEQNLFVDSTEAGRGHRINLMNGGYKEAGVGVVQGSFAGYNAVMTTQDFASSSGNSFLTGVAFNDAVQRDNFYQPGEGLGGATITAVRTADHAYFSTTTWAAGGYRLALPAGTYTVTGSGGGLGGTVTFGNVVIGSQNVERDFTPAQAVSTPSPTPTPAPTTTGTWAGNTFQALNNVGGAGVARSGNAVGYTSNGSWIQFNNVNFGTGNFTKFVANLAVGAGYGGQKIVLHVDGLSGPTIGTLTTTSTGSWSTYDNQSTGIARVTGVHNLYIQFVGTTGIANLQSFYFA